MSKVIFGVLLLVLAIGTAEASALSRLVAVTSSPLPAGTHSYVNISGTLQISLDGSDWMPAAGQAISCVDNSSYSIQGEGVTAHGDGRFNILLGPLSPGSHAIMCSYSSGDGRLSAASTTEVEVLRLASPPSGVGCMPVEVTIEESNQGCLNPRAASHTILLPMRVATMPQLSWRTYSLNSLRLAGLKPQQNAQGMPAYHLQLEPGALGLVVNFADAQHVLGSSAGQSVRLTGHLRQESPLGHKCFEAAVHMCASEHMQSAEQ